VVPLPSREAQTMAMTIHELTTNVAKYGALKADKGRLKFDGAPIGGTIGPI
jgi:two-component sensor histidine kinase